MDLKIKPSWLGRYLARAVHWIAANPVIIILVIIVVSFNYVAARGNAMISVPVKLTGLSIYDALNALLLQLRSPSFVILAGLAAIAASALTIFEFGTLFAIFERSARPLLVGAQRAVSAASLRYFLFSGTAYACYGAFGLLVSQLIVVDLRLTGIGGGLLLIAVVALSYPVLYMLLSVGGVLSIPRLTRLDLKLAAKAITAPANLTRLLTFYMLRIGLETALLLVGGAVTGYLGLPVYVAGTFVVLAVSLPFSLIRTTGFVLKLDVLKGVPWFSEGFSNYYETQVRTNVSG